MTAVPIPPIDPAARPLIASDGVVSDAELLADSEGVLSRAKAALEDLERRRNPGAPALRDLCRLFGASIRRACDLRQGGCP